MPREADFREPVKKTLAGKAGYRCSNPFCRKSTIGANANGSGTISIGEAAHITAAQPGGARYDASLDDEQRKSEKNGIWLCRNHAAMIDRDEQFFTVELLTKWKIEAEKEANARILGLDSSEKLLYSLRVLLDDLNVCNKEISAIRDYNRAIVISPNKLPVTNDYEKKLEELSDAIGMEYASRIRSSFRDIDAFKIDLGEEYRRFKNGNIRMADMKAVYYHHKLRAFLARLEEYDIQNIINTLEPLFDKT